MHWSYSQFLRGLIPPAPCNFQFHNLGRDVETSFLKAWYYFIWGLIGRNVHSQNLSLGRQSLRSCTWELDSLWTFINKRSKKNQNIEAWIM